MSTENRYVRRISAEELHGLIVSGSEIALIDVREAGQFGLGHMLLASSVPLSVLELQIPLMVPRKDTPIALIAGDDYVSEVASARLAEMRFTDARVLDGGMEAWTAAGYRSFIGVNVPSKALGELAEAAKHTPHISAAELKALQDAGKPVVLLDGRTYAEHRRMAVPEGISVPNGELILRFDDVVPAPEVPVVIHCAGRTRSLIGAQTLRNAGIPNPVFALKDGTMGWRMAGYQLLHGNTARFPALSKKATETALQRAKKLRESYSIPAISFQDIPALTSAERTTYLLDVRTSEEFRAGHIPGAIHTPGGQLVQKLDEHCAVQSAVLILLDDGDGVRATTAAHWLVQLGWDVRVVVDPTSRPRLVTGTAPASAIPEFILRRTNWVRAEELRKGQAARSKITVDVGSSADFMSRSIPGSVWTSRARLREFIAGLDETSSPIFVCEDGKASALAAFDYEEVTGRPAQTLLGGKSGWIAASLPITSGKTVPPERRIDFLFWAHDRHTGNDEASRAYLDWEHSLVKDVAETSESRIKIR